METVKINDNITVCYIPMQKLKTTHIGVYIHRPLCEGEVSKNALLPYVLKRGCRLCPDSEATSKHLENLYGATFGASVMKMGDDQIIYMGFETISDRYAANGEKLSADLVKLIMSVMFEPTGFTDEITAQEKQNSTDRILAEIDDKRVYSQKRCCALMCEGSAFALGALGTKEGIEEITTADLKAHYENIITSSPIDIYVCGDADVNAIADEIKSYTEKLSFNQTALPKSELFAREGEIKRVTDHMEVTQGKLCLGMRTNIAPDSDDYIALMVTNSVFGGGAHSKLFNNVREKLSLCYYASSSLVRSKGIMFVNAGIEFENFEKAYDEILAQLEAVKNGDISDFEYQSSIAFLVNQLESYKDDERLMQYFALQQKLSGTNTDIDTLKEKISRVTVEDIKRTARSIELDTVYFLAGKEE